MRDKKMTDRDRQAASHKRGLNMIWTAAEKYDFQPEFTAFRSDGSPDLYMNSMIGYVRKWYDHEILERLFSDAKKGMFTDTYEGIIWFALENCAYLKEVCVRPALAELRRQHARDFFLEEGGRSRQQWMAANSIIYDLESAKWRQVLGKPPGLVNPWEKKLFQELMYPETITSQEIYDRTTDIFRRYFGFRGHHRLTGIFDEIREKILGPFLRRGPVRMVRTDELIIARKTADGTKLHFSGGRRSSAGTPEGRGDQQYIRNCFGLPMFSEEESLHIDRTLCSGPHRGCHIYLTDGISADRSGKTPKDATVRKFLSDAAIQRQKNESYLMDHRNICRNGINRLAQQICNAMLVYPQPLSIPSRSGRLFPREIWKAMRLDDNRIFTQMTEEQQPDFSVDLMLDASASRLDSQQIIAMQGYMIAESLKKCGIPAQVYSFLSIRGYTVMRRFFGYDDKEKEKKLLDYCAAGWNRDGLAFRGAGYLMNSSPAKNKILIVLTDASPNDDRKVPADLSEGRVINREYSGVTGIEDTAGEVRTLRKAGVKVIAIINGRSPDTRAAMKIYQKDFVMIKSPVELARAAGDLIQKQIMQFYT